MGILSCKLQNPILAHLRWNLLEGCWAATGSRGRLEGRFWQPEGASERELIGLVVGAPLSFHVCPTSPKIPIPAREGKILAREGPTAAAAETPGLASPPNKFQEEFPEGGGIQVWLGEPADACPCWQWLKSGSWSQAVWLQIQPPH